jgi:hypothetical protein
MEKRMKRLATLAFVTLGLTLGSYAFGQGNTATATAMASATIITPISISKITDLNFDSVITGPCTGTVVYDTTGVRTASGCATLGSGSFVTVATFQVGGQVSATYNITLPSSPITIYDSVSDAMTVDTFVSDPSGMGALDGNGNQIILVGATLEVGANQPTGVYSGFFDVSVTYN